MNAVASVASSDGPPEEKLRNLLEQLLKGDMRQTLQSAVKKNFRKVRQEILGQNRAILKFIQMNMSAENAALDELMGLSPEASATQPSLAENLSDDDLPRG